MARRRSMAGESLLGMNEVWALGLSTSSLKYASGTQRTSYIAIRSVLSEQRTLGYLSAALYD